MSSIVVIQHSDAIHLITDGAQYDHDEVVLGFASKVVHLHLSGCVFALRGANWAAIPLEFALRRCGSLDEIVEALPSVLRLLLHEYDDVAPDALPVERHFEITIAGWSDRMQRMVALVASTYAACDPGDLTGISHQPGYASCTPWLPGQGYAQPPVDFQGVLGRVFTEQAHIDAIDPETDGFALHEEQRNEGGVYCGRAAYLVGGFAELTTVRRGHVERTLLREWPDVVGQKIQPAGAAPLDVLQALLGAVEAKDEAVRAYTEARQKAQASKRCSGRIEMAA